MKDIKYIEVFTAPDDSYLQECFCNEDDDSLEIDYDKREVYCSLCGHAESNWLITCLIDLYTPGIVDKDCEAQIKSFYYDFNVEAENADIQRSIEYLKHARLT